MGERERAFEMLVPVEGICLLYPIQNRKKRAEELGERGADGVLATVNLGVGRALAYGTGRTRRNERAQRMLFVWMGAHIAIYGPCVLIGVTAREALELLTQTAGSFKVSLDIEEQR